MIAVMASQTAETQWHDTFLEMLPKIVHIARFAFRKFDQDRREEAVQEVVANCLVAYRRLVDQGREEQAYPSSLAHFAIRQFYAGRCVGSPLNIQDVTSKHCQRRKGFSMEGMYQQDERTGRWFPFVVEDDRTPVPDQAAFRLDFPTWLHGLSQRDRAMAEGMALGETTSDLARRFRVSPARVSQLRREFYESWEAFHDPPEASAVEA